MKLHVDVSGMGPDLVLLHGWGIDATVWNELAAALAPAFTVHRIDSPGYGAARGSPPMTPDDMVHALAESMPARVIVAGWSLGAQVALAWAARGRAQVTKLILISATPRFVNTQGWMHGVDAAVFDSFATTVERDTAAALGRFASLQAAGDAQAHTVLRMLRQRALAPPLPDTVTLLTGLRALAETDWRGRLQHIHQPSLLLHGERDELVPLAAAQSLASELPSARLVRLPQAAHAPFLPRADCVARHIHEFLS